MAQREIRIVVLDTTGPTERLGLVPCPWALALEFHGISYQPNQLQNQPQKGRLRGRALPRLDSSVRR